VLAQPAAAQCCIVGGGPAGIMLGLLFARAGISVCVMEKHADFLRDFRGDTIHPSTLEVMHELGLLDEFLTLPHQKVAVLNGEVGGERITMADFSNLPVHCPFIAMMPQWDFLNFLARKAAAYPGFQLMMETEGLALIEESGRVTGVRAQSTAGAFDVHASLTIAADGRHSALRAQAGLIAEDFGAPMDVLWFALPRRDGDPHETTGRFDSGRIMVQIDRGTHWQCGYVIAKGSAEALRAQGIEAFRDAIVAVSHFDLARLAEIQSFDQVKLLTVGVDRLKQWWMPGLLCIGDAAHTMSPAGGVGINLAIQDSVAAANILSGPLRAGTLADADLRKVQARREWPVKVTQRIQIAIQDYIISATLQSRGPTHVPFALSALQPRACAQSGGVLTHPVKADRHDRHGGRNWRPSVAKAPHCCASA
jgi:2-polyprenyl-6-methoxyphenol hydroxylase-like FAD-dependent oxidoreductase